MNYRHIYHAGSFADIMKHTILIALMLKLQEKDKPFTVLDAFAGIGLYDLLSEEASKTNEAKNGIQILLDSLETAPSLLPKYIAQYVELIRSLNPTEKSIQWYPGSPYIIAELLRNEDNLIACELHPQDYALLKHALRNYPAAAVHHIDAYSAIKAFLPPKHTRGLILLDPPFEVKDEFSKIIDALKLIRKRYSAGVVMIWYPIKDRKSTEQFYDDLKATNYPEFIKIEFEIASDEIAMNKCGVLIANPPYIKDELEELMNFLCKFIYQGKAKSTIELASFR